MRANERFLNKSLEFWANIKFLSQEIGYTERKTKGIRVPTITEIREVYHANSFDINKVYQDSQLTPFGQELMDYFVYRREVINNFVRPNLMNKDSAGALFNELRQRYHPTCPLPMNKQKGEKKDYSFFTGIINMLIEANLTHGTCDFEPRKLTCIVRDRVPSRTLSRWIDGAYPSLVNPIAIWEIKEYYYTTTFGSRVADGVYETLVDGYELREIRDTLGIDVEHYLMVDDYYTWWDCGRSYLCRIIDIMHMGFLTEAIFGKEVLTAVPRIVNRWNSI